MCGCDWGSCLLSRAWWSWSILRFELTGRLDQSDQPTVAITTGNAEEDERIQAMMRQEADQWQQNLEDLPQSVHNPYAIGLFVIGSIALAAFESSHTDTPSPSSRFSDTDPEPSFALDQNHPRHQEVRSSSSACPTRMCRLGISATAVVRRVRLPSEIVSRFR